ncbi:Asp23/Gls24 family envelope stress response protein [bacterium]|nr:Asp23/Gls24 family envelope stress response protein [bacterium]
MTEKVPGSLTVADDVFADLAGYAAKECYGVVGMASLSGKDRIALLPGQRLRRGIVVSRDEAGRLTLDLNVILEYGVNIQAVSRNLVDAVQFVLRGVAQIDDAQVRVHVRGMKVRPA